MKHKKHIKILIPILLVFSIACTDFLEQESMTQISEDHLYSTPEGLEFAVNGLYNRMRRYNFPSGEGQPLRANVFFYVAHDLGLHRTWFTPYQESTMTPIAFPDYKWTFGYLIIDKANAIISMGSEIDMDETEKNKLIAQARLVRAEVYLDLLRMYDNIVLDTTPTTPENFKDEVTYLPANPTDVYRLIDEDLDFAIANLEWDVPFGRYGQGVARHIRGKSSMWQGKWAEAAAQFDSIILNPTHDLVDLEQVFGQNADHKETLFAYPRNVDLGGGDELAGGDGTWFGSVFRARNYEITTGEIIATVENGGESLGWFFPNDYLQSLYDKENDNRYEIYYYPLELTVNNPVKSNFGEPLPEASYPDNFRQYHWSLRKYHDYDPLSKPATTNNSFKSIVYYRYAESLLLGAEAHWRMSGESPSNATALNYINQIRIRAGLEDDLFTQFTLDNYLEESARELAFEKNRWFLLKRMGLLVERQSLHYRSGSNSSNIKPFPMKDHMVRLPIPQSEIDLMGTFPQNDHYF